MNRRAISGCLAAALCLCCLAFASADGFSYGDQAAWAFVSGRMQSPIDIETDTAEPATPAIALALDPGAAATYTHDNGHTIEVGLAGESLLDGRPFTMLQMHLHAPSEHSVDGFLAAAELHIVHRSQAGRLAVVGVLLAEGAHNDAFAAILDAIRPGEMAPAPAVFSLAALLPEGGALYHYLGSLTTPPLTENVEWYVLARPVEISAAQLAAFRAHYDGNNRDVQPLDGRVLLVSGE